MRDALEAALVARQAVHIQVRGDDACFYGLVLAIGRNTFEFERYDANDGTFWSHETLLIGDVRRVSRWMVDGCARRSLDRCLDADLQSLASQDDEDPGEKQRVRL